jgi:MSHA biogenesis protein MshQ
VNVTSLSSTEDTAIYIYYGNPSCGNQQDLNGVWDSDFVMVQHLNESSGKHYDSTYYCNDGSPKDEFNQDAVGKMDGADEFDGTDGEIKVSNDDSLNFEDTNKFSISVWINRNNHLFSDSRSIISKGTSSLYCGYNFYVSGDKRIGFGLGDGSTNYRCKSNIFSDTGIWYHTAGTWDGNTLYLYINGELDNSTYLGDVFIKDDTKALQIGNHWWDHWFPGIIDEVRISETCRSDAWIITSFNNMDDSSSFYIVGPEESAP